MQQFVELKEHSPFSRLNILISLIIIATCKPLNLISIIVL